MEKKQINAKKIKDLKNKRKKKKIWKKVLLLFLLIILIAGGIFAYRVYKNGGGITGILATVVGHDENTRKNLGEFRVLILGISTDQEGVDLTDTIIVASYNPNTQKATLLSIPRDTYTGKNPSKATAYEKINSLYSRKHRPDETLQAVNEITGLNIEYYVVIQNDALIKLVDVIGGITFNVPIDMDYDDPAQDLHIHLKAGEQLLDGDKAEQLVRFRHNNDWTTYPEEYGDNDAGRMRTQREFIMEVLKQTAKPGNIWKLGQILDVAKENVKTNIDFNVAKDYIPYIVEFSTDNLLNATLPGVNTDNNTNKVWVFVHNQAETEELVKELFFDRDIETTPEEQTTNVEGTANENVASNNTTIKLNKEELKIEILNGSGESKKLQQAVNQIEGAGYKVTRTGATNTTSKTAIINKKSVSSVLLKNMKDVIGIGNISESESSSSKVDVTIIIGKDYQ